MRITVDRMIGDDMKLSWDFDFHTDFGDRITLTLEGYTRYMRPSKRHSWKTEAWYSRISSRGCTLTRNDVELPADVVHDARTVVIHKMQALEVKDSY